jgi:hypothetical protein
VLESKVNSAKDAALDEVLVAGFVAISKVP